MGLTCVNGWYYWVKRVPKRYKSVALGPRGRPVTQVRQALHTENLIEARAKAAQVEAARLAEWEAAIAGDSARASQHYIAARRLAEARGFQYMSLSDLVSADPGEVLDRVLSLKSGPALANSTVAEAVLGRVPEALPTIAEVMDEYFALTKTRHTQKSPAQYQKWKQKRTHAVGNFLAVVAKKRPGGQPVPMPVSEITRADALKFRDWWSAKVEGGMRIDSANKDISHLSEMLRTWAKLKGLDLPDPFEGLRLEGKDATTRPAFSRHWVKFRLLAPGALDRLNAEARDVLLITINTGLRPSEITDAPAEDFQVDAPVPFLRVAPHGRELKVAHTRRDIPLLGVALEAARRIVERGGIERYAHKANAWSAAVNKYMRENGLRETPKHSAYSIRHYVENALLAAKVDDRVRADILGHKYDRPRYGDGGGLRGRRDALEKIAL